MSDLTLNAILRKSAIAPVFEVAYSKLIAGTVVEVVSGLYMLAALWFLIQFIAYFNTLDLLWTISFWVIAAVLTALASWLVHDAEAKFSAQLRRKVAQHLIRLPSSSLAKQGDQSLKHLVSDDISALHHMVAHLPSEVAIFSVIPLVSIAVLLSVVGLSALWILLPGCLAAMYYLLVVPYVSKRDGAARMQVMMDIIAKADDYVRGIRVNRIYGQQTGALTDYTQATEKFTKNMVTWVAKVAVYAAIAVALLQAVATFAIAYWVSYQQGTVVLATALFFSLAIVTPALRLGHGLDYVAAAKAASTRIDAFLKLPTLTSEIDEKSVQFLDAFNANTPELKKGGALKIFNLHIDIAGQKIAQDFNFTFAPRTLTAITGPSGVGKSTLLRAIAGLERLKSGEILWQKQDGQTIHLNDLHINHRHQYILYVPQGMDVLDASVRENLLLSQPNATDAVLKTALDQAQLTVDLEANATLLSGGERQRIGIARAFLSDVPIILFDEPTSALDHAHAMKLMLALKDLAVSADKTMVMVTHDQGLVQHLDASFVLQGKENNNE